MENSKVAEIVNFILADGGQSVHSEKIEEASRFGTETIEVEYLRWRSRFVKVYSGLEDGLCFFVSDPAEKFAKNLKWKSIFEFSTQERRAAGTKSENFLAFLKEEIEIFKMGL